MIEFSPWHSLHPDESARLVERENTRVTHEWGQLIAKVGPACGEHPEAVQLAEQQGRRAASIMQKK